MKIVYVSYSVIPSLTANSVHVMKMCQAFAKQGHDVTLFAPGIVDGQISTDDNFVFYNVEPLFKIKKLYCPPIRGKRYIYAVNVFLTLLFLKPQVVFGREILGCWIAKMMGFSIAFESHAPIWFQKRIERIAFNSIVKSKKLLSFIVISSALKKMYVDKYPQIAEVIHVAHDGSDELPVECKRIKLMGSNDLNIGYVGSLYEGRGIELIIELSERFDYVDFHIVGGGDLEVKKWKQLIINENIFFHGFHTQKNILSFLRSFDIVLAPYQPNLKTYGGGRSTIDWMSPLKIFEYMASGTAIVSSEFPVLKEVLTDKKNVLFCDHANVSSWESSIQLLLDDTALRNKLADQAKKEFQENYTWSKRADNIINFL